MSLFFAHSQVDTQRYTLMNLLRLLIRAERCMM